MTIDDAIMQQISAAEAFEKAALEGGVSELTREGRKMVAADHRQLAEWLTELKEAKRLLALAVEDFKTIGEVRATPTPMIHPKYIEYTRIIDILDLNWRHTDEALKLIGND